MGESKKSSRRIGGGAAVVALLIGCARPAAAPAETRLPAGVHLLTAAAQRAEWCVNVTNQSECQDFRDVPAQEILRFEARFSEQLKARGYAQEAELLPTFDRTYWGIFC